MVSLFQGTDNVISKFLGVDRKKLANKTTHVKPIKEQDSFSLIDKMYATIERNYLQVGSKPRSKSNELWRCRPMPNIEGKNPSREKILEKAVAMLAAKGQMPEWFNQCPVASGITDPNADRKRAIDLVNWSKSDRHVRLIELKWESNSPLYALFEVLEYGLAYIFCRIHKKELPLQCPSLMNARHVSLEVIAPCSFYINHHDKNDFFAQMSKSLNKFASSKINGLTMSLDALAFPAGFQIPFKNGKEVEDEGKCDTDKGRAIFKAFNNLAQVWP